jgi:hypothetical protein
VIKEVSPVLVSGMDYGGLEIGDGDTVIARFARTAMGEYSAEEEERTRKDLLDYCRQDTLAMVRLHEELEHLSQGAV